MAFDINKAAAWATVLGFLATVIYFAYHWSREDARR